MCVNNTVSLTEAEVNSFIILGQKICSKCNVFKHKESFVKDRSKYSGYYSSCKDCNAARRKKYYMNNRKRLIQQVVEKTRNCPKATARKRKYARSEKGKAVMSAWRAANREELNRAEISRINNNPELKLVTAQRKRISKLLSTKGKSKRTLEYLGCTGVELKQHIEKMFCDNMSWDNYGSYWHVDHIKPCSAFDLSKEDERVACFHYTNLQPLEKHENLRKGSLYEGKRHFIGKRK